MIDNATTAIDQWDIADKTRAVQPCMAICIYCSSLWVYDLIFMYSMGQINVAKQRHLLVICKYSVEVFCTSRYYSI